MFGKAFYKSHKSAVSTILAVDKAIKEGNTSKNLETDDNWWAMKTLFILFLFPYLMFSQKIFTVDYESQADSRYAAARLWVDEIIFPHKTREKFIYALEVISNIDSLDKPNYGVLQVWVKV